MGPMMIIMMMMMGIISSPKLRIGPLAESGYELLAANFTNGRVYSWQHFSDVWSKQWLHPNSLSSPIAQCTNHPPHLRSKYGSIPS